MLTSLDSGPVSGGSNLRGISGRSQASRVHRAGGRVARPTARSTRVDSRGSPIRQDEVNQAHNRESATLGGRQPVYSHPLGPPQWNWGLALTNAGKENVAPGEGEAGSHQSMGPSNGNSQHGGRSVLQVEQTATQCPDSQSEGEVDGRESLDSQTSSRIVNLSEDESSVVRRSAEARILSPGPFSALGVEGGIAGRESLDSQTSSRIVNLSDGESSVIERSAETQILSPSPLSAMRAAQLANIAGMVDQAKLGTPGQTQQPEDNAPEIQHEQQTLGAAESRAIGSTDASSSRTSIGSPLAGISGEKHEELADDKSDNDGTREGDSTVIHHPQPMPHVNASASGGQRGPDNGLQVTQSAEVPQIDSPEEVSTIKSRLKKRFLRFKNKVRGIRLLPKKS